MIPLYINYPSWIHPEIFPGIPVLGLIRWYGLMYIFAFGTAFLVLKQLLKEGALDSVASDGTKQKATEDDIFNFIATGIIFLLIGARIFSTLVYDTSGEYWKKPWLIFSPFQNGHFTGLAGMSYHGGFIGGALGMVFWCWKHKRPFMKWADAMCTAIPLGYTFGRIGNFMNGELYGRITTMPWGMVFPAAERFSAKLPWVQAFAAKIGMTLPEGGLVNLPRHPSQLYEAFFEGIILWLIIWFCRKHKKFDGMLGAIYAGGYGFFRFFIEYLREPDADLGYRIAKDASAAQFFDRADSLLFDDGFCRRHGSCLLAAFKEKIMKNIKKIALILAAILLFQPLTFAVDTQLNKEIIALELELTKMKTRTGEYSELSEGALNRKIARTEKKLAKKKKAAKKEAEKDAERIKKGAKKAGKNIKEAGKEIGDTFKDLFN